MVQEAYLIGDIAQMMQAADGMVTVAQLVDGNARIDSMAYDTRKLQSAERALFFALEGLRDGHIFVGDAYQTGVRNFVVSDRYQSEAGQFPSANFLFVRDPLRAMQALAKAHRQRFAYPVLTITGSNGKTIVKDWLYQLLSPEHSLVRSPKSFNSQLGVALSLWQMDESHDLALIEAGISRKGEMQVLSDMIRPDIALLTNLGAAHQAGFADMEEKLREKLLLLKGAGRVVFPRDQVGEYFSGDPGEDPDRSGVKALFAAHGTDIWDWGFSGEARLHLENIEKNYTGHPGMTRITAKLAGEQQRREISIPFTDTASIENAISCWTVLLMLDYGQAVIEERMLSLHRMEMRLEMKQGIHDCTIIDDSYSNDLSSLAISLDMLNQQKQHPVRTLILSDLPEAGMDEESLYEKVRDLLRSKALDRLITVGPALVRWQGTFPVEEHTAFKTTRELLDALPGLRLQHQAILIKGARKFAFEQISSRLVAKSHDTVMEIYMDVLGHNIKQFKTLLGPDTKLMVMVKAFSYGSGSFEVAQLLQYHGVDYLAVAYADEGMALREAGITLPILVMAPDRSSFELIYRYKLEPEIFSLSLLEEYLNWIRHMDIQEEVPVHIKVDTGMHRLGFSVTEGDLLGQLLSAARNTRVRSVFSHFAASGDPLHDNYTEAQMKAFDDFTGRLETWLDYPFMRHMANTDAVLRHPQARYDMVRLGIGLYGQGAVSLKTTIIQIRDLKAGETVGYGRRGGLQRDSRIATVKIGYADGYDRRFGNGIGQMKVLGRGGQGQSTGQEYWVPTVGDICMDMCMLDITGIPDVCEGDQVLVYGDLDQAAASIGTISYELLVSVSQRVKRIYYYE